MGKKISQKPKPETKIDQQNKPVTGHSSIGNRQRAIITSHVIDQLKQGGRCWEDSA